VRAFVAIPLETTARRAIANSMAAVIAGNSGTARWVREENLHLTVAFLGRIDAELLPMIDASLAPVAAAVSEQRLVLGGIGSFPRSRPRVLWLGLAEGAAWFTELATRVRSALVEGFGLEFDDRPPSPHVTLARLEAPSRLRPSANLLRAAESAVVDRSIDSLADRLTLFSSVVRRGGPTYSVEREWPFGRGGEKRGRKD